MERSPDCPEIRELLSPFIEGELGGDDNARVARHVAACPQCLRELDRLQETVRALRCLPQVAPPPEMIFNVRRAIRQSEPRIWSLRLPIGLPWVRSLAPVAAMLVVVATILLVRSHFPGLERETLRVTLPETGSRPTPVPAQPMPPVTPPDARPTPHLSAPAPAENAPPERETAKNELAPKPVASPAPPISGDKGSATEFKEVTSQTARADAPSPAATAKREEDLVSPPAPSAIELQPTVSAAPSLPLGEQAAAPPDEPVPAGLAGAHGEAGLDSGQVAGAVYRTPSPSAMKKTTPASPAEETAPPAGMGLPPTKASSRILGREETMAPPPGGSWAGVAADASPRESGPTFKMSAGGEAQPRRQREERAPSGMPLRSESTFQPADELSTARKSMAPREIYLHSPPGVDYLRAIRETARQFGVSVLHVDPLTLTAERRFLPSEDVLPPPADGLTVTIAAPAGAVDQLVRGLAAKAGIERVMPAGEAGLQGPLPAGEYLLHVWRPSRPTRAPAP